MESSRFRDRPTGLIEFRNREQTRSKVTALCHLYREDAGYFCILALLGLGGIGKTELSRQLKKDLKQDSALKGISPIHVSLAIEASNTLAAPLRVIRDALPFDCLLFDYALLTYWAVTGQPVQLSPSGTLAESLVVKTLEGGVNVAGACFPIALSIEVFRVIRKKILKHRHYDKNEFDEVDILRLEPDQLLKELPRYLGSDIRRHIEAKERRFFFFYDAYERQSPNTLRNKGKWLQEFIQNVGCGIHIIASRESLRWESDDWYGRYEEMIIGPLPSTDCKYLVKKMTGTRDEGLVTHIVKISRGIPFFLEASIYAYRAILRKNGKVTKSDLPSSQTNAISRLFDHLGHHEADLLKTIALLRVFDRYLFCFLIREFHFPISCFAFEDFEALYFVEQYIAEGQICKVHDVLADFALKSKLLSPYRLPAAASGLHSLNLRSISGAHPQEVLPFFLPLIQLCEEIPEIPTELVECLVDIGCRLYDMGAWKELASMEASSDKGTALSIRVAKKFLSAISLRRSRSVDEAYVQLKEISSHRHCLGRHALSLELEMAYLCELKGNYTSSRASFSSLWRQCSTFDPTSRMHFRTWLYHADMLTMDGRLQEGAELLQEAMEKIESRRELDWVELLRHRAHAFRFSYLLEDAERMYLKGLQFARTPCMEGKLMSNLAETRCWSEYDLACHDAQKALEINGRVNNQIEIAKNHTSLAIAHCGLGLLSEARYHNQEALDRFRRVGYASGIVFARIAEFFIVKKSGDEPEANRLFMMVVEELEQLQTYGHLLAPLLRAQEDYVGLGMVISKVQWIRKIGVKGRIDHAVTNILRKGA